MINCLFQNTIKTKASLVGLFLVFGLVCFGQQPVFNAPVRNVLSTRSIVEHQNYYYSIGQYVDLEVGRYGLKLLKIDSMGTVVGEKKIVDSTLTIYPPNHICIEKTLDGNFITVISKGSDTVINSILKFDPNLDTIAIYTPINDGTIRVFEQAKQLPDSGFVATGLYYDQPKNMYHANLVRLDKNGQLLWEKIYKEPDTISLYPRQVYLTPDGGFLLTGQKVYLADFQTADALLIRVDNQGNELWRKTYGGSMEDGMASAAYRDDGKIIVSYSQETHPIQQGHSFAPVISVIDDQTGQELNKKLYQFLSYRNNIVYNLLKDGNKFIATGEYSHNSTQIPGGGTQGYTLAVDENLNDLWFRNYNPQGALARLDEDAALYDLRPTPDGGYIASGHIVIFDTTHISSNLGYNGWIVKMDSMGCVEQSTCINRIGTEEQTAQEDLSFEVYPNPSSGAVNVKLATEANGTATLYDLKGVKLSETKLVKGVGIINTHPNIPDGVYLIHAVDEGGNHTSEKVIIQR